MSSRLVAVLATVSLCTSAMASDLNLRVESGGVSSIKVIPGAVVQYEVIGQLNNTLNEGLALFAFDLQFDGGDLDQADTPTEPPLNNFANNLGINNPAGFGGTVIDGNLVQVGGGQNTIKNTTEYAPYPIGEVITGVGHDAVVLVTGELSAPMTPGIYTLQIANVIANVIEDEETGLGEFWAVEAAGVGSLTPLVMEVTDNVPLSIVGSQPATNSIDARQPSDDQGNNPAGWDSIVLEFSGMATGVTAEDIAVESTAGKLRRSPGVTTKGASVTVQLDGRIPTGAWTSFTYSGGGSVRLGFLPADVNSDRISNPMDILALIDGLNGVITLEPWQSDIDRSGQFQPLDIITEIDLLNGRGRSTCGMVPSCRSSSSYRNWPTNSMSA